MAARRRAIVAAASGAVWLASRRIRTPAVILAALLAALPFAACGGSGEREAGVSVTVTRDFGKRQVASERLPQLEDGATAADVLREAEAPAGGALFVNGVRPEEPPDEYELSGGDRLQLDLTASPTRAIVGAFPDPFLQGLDGRRRPVRVECDDADSAPCNDAKDALGDAGVPVSGSSLGAPGTENVTRLVVAKWPAARIVRGGHTLELGPRQSGVYARFSGNTLELLDAEGEVARTAPPGTALIAALRPRADELVWLVTALDDAGLAAGVQALKRDALRNAFSVAVTADAIHKLPL
jgi:hypothetical protein